MHEPGNGHSGDDQHGLKEEGWGLENIPYPEGPAYINTRWDLCTGCGACEMACSMFHFGVINRELSRIRIYRYVRPVPKSLQTLCSQCPENERECEKACPLEPPVITYDLGNHHMIVDMERCMGSACGKCRDACPAKVPRFYPPEHDYSLVCDLCEREGKRFPQCVEICPNQALEFLNPSFPQHLERIHPDEKAECLRKRLHPLPEDRFMRLPEEIRGKKQDG
ncbi:MAG: 4Fe-4S dicluster domain-containing protein [Deltaproteobacteria bacterium]|nr:4Fe-4S dicluster domain-containing protein [Deltaproteobacteria bacterium]